MHSIRRVAGYPDTRRTLINELFVLNEKVHVLLIGHAQIKRFQDPELPTAYDRYQLKINDKAAALVREAADAVLFATVRLRTHRTKGSGSRIATLTMVFKLGLEAQKHWRRLQGFELIPKVVTGVRFVDDEEQTEEAA